MVRSVARHFPLASVQALVIGRRSDPKARRARGPNARAGAKLPRAACARGGQATTPGVPTKVSKHHARTYNDMRAPINKRWSPLLGHVQAVDQSLAQAKPVSAHSTARPPLANASSTRSTLLSETSTPENPQPGLVLTPRGNATPPMREEFENGPQTLARSLPRAGAETKVKP